MSTARLLGVAIVVLVIGIGIQWSRSDSQLSAIRQQVVMPGALSQSHAFLSEECTACHTPVKGIEPTLCISCHANNTALLQRQPTAFHADVQVCSGCHLEHRGTLRMPTTMDHSLLAKVGREQMTADVVGGLPRPGAQAPAPGASAVERISLGVRADHAGSKADESMLDCASCHTSKDRHRGFMGTDCVQCHATTQWSIAEFVHPSTSSTECAQCHLPPPSHNMMHFSMMSAPLAKQPNAKVNQCFLCHQTTVWNDIKGLGWKKVH